MKCETPARSDRSSREPAPIQKPIATERTCASRSEITRSPESSSLSVYFCIPSLSLRPREKPVDECDTAHADQHAGEDGRQRAVESERDPGEQCHRVGTREHRDGETPLPGRVAGRLDGDCPPGRSLASAGSDKREDRQDRAKRGGNEGLLGSEIDCDRCSKR